MPKGLVVLIICMHVWPDFDPTSSKYLYCSQYINIKDFYDNSVLDD